MNADRRKRVLAAAAALASYAACGDAAGPAPAQHTAHGDLPKMDYARPRSQETPQSFDPPRPVRQRPSRGSTRPRPEPPPARNSNPVGDDIWRRLANCESSDGRDSASGRYHGYFQFSIPTWRSVGGEGDPHEFSYEEQKAKAIVLQARDGWGQWPRCRVKLGLR